MSFSLYRSDLVRWLSIIVDFLPTGKHEDAAYKAIHFVPDSEEEDEMRMQCSVADSLIFALAGLDVASGDPVDCAVPAADLRHIVLKGGGAESTEVEEEDTVIFDVKEDTVVIVSGDFTTEVDKVDTKGEITLDDNDERVSHGKISVNALASSLEASLPFLGKDLARPELMGVYLSGTNLYASNGEHGALFSLKDMEFPDEGLNFIPYALIAILKSASSSGKDKKIKILSDSEWVIFMGGPFVLCLKRHIGEFAVDIFMDYVNKGEENRSKITISGKSLKTAYERVRYFIDTKNISVLRIDRKRPYLAGLRGSSHSARSFLSAGTSAGKKYDIYIPIESIESLLKAGVDKFVFAFDMDDVDDTIDPPIVGGVVFLEYENMKYWLLPSVRG